MAAPNQQEDKKTAAQLKKEEAAKKALEKQEEANRQELLDTITSGFKVIASSNSSLEKIMQSQYSLLKSNSSVTKKMSSSLEKYFESSSKKLERTADSTKFASDRLFLILKRQIEANQNNVVVLYDKQFAVFEKYFESSGKKLERTADSTKFSSDRLFLILKRQIEANSSNTVTIEEKQWEIFKKIRERLVKIQMHTDNTSSRVWVLQDLVKETNKAILSIQKTIAGLDLSESFGSFPTWFEIYVQKPLNRLHDLISNKMSGDSGETSSLSNIQYNGLMMKLDKLVNNEKLFRLLGGSGSGAGHLHHIRALLRTLIKTVRNDDGGGGGNNSNQSNTPPSPRQRQNNGNGRVADIVAPWMKDLGVLWNRFTNNFMGVFQRGVIGRITSLNPLIGMATDVIRDVGTTISDIAGTFWQTYLLFAHLMQNRAAIGSGVSRVRDNVVGKYQALVEGLAKVGQVLLTNFGSISAIGTTISRGFGFIKSGFGDVTAMFGRGLLNTFTSFASGGFRGMLGDFNKFTKTTKLGKLLKPLEYIQSIFTAFGDAYDFMKQGNWIGGLISGGLRIAFTELKLFIDMVVDIPTQLLSWVTGWLGMDKLSTFFAQDFSSMIVDTAMNGWNGMIAMFNDGFVNGLKNLGGFLKFIVFDSWSEDIKFGDVFLDIFKSIQQWLIDSYNKVIGFLPDVIRPEPIGVNSDIAKAPVIPADNTKNAQQNLADTKQAVNQVVVSSQNNVIAQPKAPPVPYSVIPASNPMFDDYS